MQKRNLTGAFAGALLLVGIATTVTSHIRASSLQEIRARDDCDSTTFNAAIGTGTCVGNGNTTFTSFLQQFQEDGSVGAWRFSPDSTEIDKGEGTLLVSRGGELHTFTRVEKFGGGIVGLLNAPGQLVAPECLALVTGKNPPGPAQPSTGSIPLFPGAAVPGPIAGTTSLPVGETHFQCCIHPWMHTTIQVKNHH